MIKVVNYIILFKLLYTFKNLHLISCTLSKRSAKKNQIYLPSITEFEVKGNALRWIPIEINENESNLDTVLRKYSENCRSRRFSHSNVHFVSGVLACGNTSATIEPNVIYDDEDDYENIESTPVSENITDTNVKVTTVIGTMKQSNISSMVTELSSTVSGLKKGTSFSGLSTSVSNATVYTTTQTTMPTKISMDECSTKESSSPTSISAKIIEETDNCYPSTEDYCTFPLIITPPNPLPPLNLDFITCKRSYSLTRQGKEEGKHVTTTMPTVTRQGKEEGKHVTTTMPTKFEEYGNKCPPKHYATKDFKTKKSILKSTLKSKKPKHYKKTIKPPKKTTPLDENYTGEFSIPTLSKWEKLFPPLRKGYQYEKTTKAFSTSTIKSYKTTKSKIKEFIQTSATTHTIETSARRSPSTTPQRSETSTRKATTKKTHPSTKIKFTTHKTTPKRFNENNFLFLKEHSSDIKDELSELSKYEHDSKIGEEAIKYHSPSKLQERNIILATKPQVVLRIPSILNDLPLVIVKDPEIPALSLSIIPPNDYSQETFPQKYPFSLPCFDNISMLQYYPLKLLKNEDLNSFNDSKTPDLNSELNFNPFNIWPFISSSNQSLIPSNKYSMISKHNFLDPQHYKLKKKRRTLRNH